MARVRQKDIKQGLYIHYADRGVTVSARVFGRPTPFFRREGRVWVRAAAGSVPLASIRSISEYCCADLEYALAKPSYFIAIPGASAPGQSLRLRVRRSSKGLRELPVLFCPFCGAKA